MGCIILRLGDSSSSFNKDNVSAKSKLQHLPPSLAYPGHLKPLRSRRGGNLIIKVFQGVGNLNCPILISREISGMVNNHGGCGVRGFSWKRLCLWGQLVTRKGLKQALCRIWRYLNFKIFNIGFRVWIYECIKLCLQWNTIPIPAIQ